MIVSWTGQAFRVRPARALSRRLVESGLLRTIEPAAGRRAALYAFDPLLDLLKV